MTERKPAGMTFTSWIDQQISDAEERGAFDNLPGTGKPLPRRQEDAGQAWLRDYLRREGVAAQEMLPVPLRLRKELERLPETVRDLRREQDVRDVVAELNERIASWRAVPHGPPVFVPLADADAVVAGWHAGRERPMAEAAADGASAAPGTAGTSPVRAPRWWQRPRGGR